MSDVEGSEGGEAACFAHLVAADGSDGGIVVVPDADDVAGSGGAVWSLPHGGDLDANLVRLDAGERIQTHGNDEVDVLVVVRAGGGELVVDEMRHQLLDGTIALVPRGASRSIAAGSDGISYLTVHRRRGPLTIGAAPLG